MRDNCLPLLTFLNFCVFIPATWIAVLYWRKIPEFEHMMFTTIIDTTATTSVNNSIPYYALSFEVCGGLTNQRIAIVQGILIAAVTKRAFVLPELYSSYIKESADYLAFSSVYDIDILKGGLRGIVDIEDSKTYKRGTKLTKANNKQYSSSQWTVMLNVEGNIDLDCTFNSIKLSDNMMLTDLYWRIDRLLVFANPVREIVKRITGAITAQGDTGYTALHFRIEEDWVTHCKIWESLGDGIIRDNCMTNSDVIANVFALERVPTNRPLYISGAYTVEFMKSHPSLQTLMRRYQVFTKDSFLNVELNQTVLKKQREIFAAVDYAVCLESSLFIGNSVSTFSAVIMMQRMHRNLSTFHYNGGDIPLEGIIPLSTRAKQYQANTPPKPLKWVFSLTLHSESEKTFVQLAKVAVMSAIQATNLDLVLLLYLPKGLVGAPWVRQIRHWFCKAGVTVIDWRPSFESKIKESFRRSRNMSLTQYSPLYKDPYQMIGAFLRLDIPKIGFLDPYVLYTDVDIMFVRDIKLSDMRKLPKYILMGIEDHSRPNIGNAGVMLLNLAGMSRTYAPLMEMTFSDQSLSNGLHFGDWGPADQGAINKFYALSKDIIKPSFLNNRPYWTQNKTRKIGIIHFHGPKPIDYRHHKEDPTKDSPNFTDFYMMCDKLVSCQVWLRKWFAMHKKIESGYIPMRKNQTFSPCFSGINNNKHFQPTGRNASMFPWPRLERAE